MSLQGTQRGIGAIIASLLLIGALSAETRWRPRPEEAEHYHARVRELAAQAPMEIGRWVGAEHRAPAEAIRLLKPNVILCRQYVHMETGRRVQLLIVHCKDARDLHGHYPPVCYPANGMELRSATDADWTVSGVSIAGKRYEFAAQRLGAEGKLVENFLIVPGRYARDMDAVGEQAGDYTRRFYGAAQVQVVFDNPRQWRIEDRAEVFETLVAAYLPLVEQIRKGAQR
jgi:hypothetical protein